MNYHPYPSNSRLSRRDLYAHGFREGQPWGDDRRSLESALKAMDALEQDIQRNYLYNRPTQYGSNGGTWNTTPRHLTMSTGYLGPHIAPNVRITRSNELADQGGYLPSENTPWYGSQHRFPLPDRTSMQSAGGRYPETMWPMDDAAYHARPSVPGHGRGYELGSTEKSRWDEQDCYCPQTPPSSSATESSYSGNCCGEIEDSPPLHPVQHEAHYSSRQSSQHSNSPQQPHQTFSPSQMQMSMYSAEPQHQMPQQNGYSDNADDMHETPVASIQSPHCDWSILTNLAASNSTADYADGRSSGYGEAYGMPSYDRQDGVGEDDGDFMSDGVASDEGVYYSSSNGEPEEDDDCYEVYSDEGYCSPSDDYYDEDY